MATVYGDSVYRVWIAEAKAEAKAELLEELAAYERRCGR